MTRQNNDRPRTPRQRLTDLVYPVNLYLMPYQRVDAGILKTIAIITMFIDHVTYAFLELPAPGQSRLMDTLPDGALLDALGRMIGRTALPIFAFLLVEGYIHTRSRGRYLLRLLLFAVLSEYPFKALFFPYDHAMHCDTLFTLSLGLIAVWIVDTVLMRYLGLESRGRNESQRATTGRGSVQADVCEGDTIAGGGVGAGADGGTGADGPIWPAVCDPWPIRIVQIAIRLVIAVSATALCCVVATRIGADYRYGGVLLVMLFYLFRGLRIAGVAAGYTWISWYNVNEIYSLAGFALIQSYNGRRGRQMKYLFYLFYPGHLMLLLIVRRWMLGF